MILQYKRKRRKRKKRKSRNWELNRGHCLNSAEAGFQASILHRASLLWWGQSSLVHILCEVSTLTHKGMWIFSGSIPTSLLCLQTQDPGWISADSGEMSISSSCWWSQLLATEGRIPRRGSSSHRRASCLLSVQELVPAYRCCNGSFCFFPPSRYFRRVSPWMIEEEATLAKSLGDMISSLLPLCHVRECRLVEWVVSPPRRTYKAYTWGESELVTEERRSIPVNELFGRLERR